MNIHDIRAHSLEYAKGNRAHLSPPKKRRRRRKRGPVNHKRNAYWAYINSPKWRVFRAGIIAARGRKCEKCRLGPFSLLHLHHLTYIRFGSELPEDVQLLCVDCHGKLHPKALPKSFVQWFAKSLDAA